MKARRLIPITPARGAGFTLIELMVAVAILAILLGIAAPSFREIILNARMTGMVNDIVADLALARSEAVKRNERIAICVSNNQSAAATCTGGSWADGWIVFVDLSKGGARNTGETLLKVAPALPTGTTVTASTTTIPYRPTGATNPAGGNITFTICDTRTSANVGAAAAQNKGRVITINNTGRPVISKTTC